MGGLGADTLRREQRPSEQGQMPAQWSSRRLAMPQDVGIRYSGTGLCSSIPREERRSFPGVLMIPERGRFSVLTGKQNPMTLKQLAG